MNLLPTILIGLAVAGLLFLAIRYVVKNGACAACESKEACHAAKNGADFNNPSGCSGKCSSCRYYESEMKALAEKQSEGTVYRS